MDPKYLEAVKTLLEADDVFVVVSVGWDADRGHWWNPFPVLMNVDPPQPALDDFLVHQVEMSDEHEPGDTLYLYRLRFEPSYEPCGGFEVSERIVLEHHPPAAEEPQPPPDADAPF